MGYAGRDVPDVVDISERVEVRAPVAPSESGVSKNVEIWEEQRAYSMLVGALDNIARMSLTKYCVPYDAVMGSSICGSCADDDEVAGGVVVHVSGGTWAAPMWAC